MPIPKPRKNEEKDNPGDLLEFDRGRRRVPGCVAAAPPGTRIHKLYHLGAAAPLPDSRWDPRQQPVPLHRVVLPALLP